jgi:hypothetical protein
MLLDGHMSWWRFLVVWSLLLVGIVVQDWPQSILGAASHIGETCDVTRERVERHNWRRLYVV